ncbi:DUF1761 domain-containing protein [Candidatus Pacearchaeota archaeon]|nr:DUF1761 domain-containing protein [Candidatus Pacearchaeota archaeon]
MVFSSYSADGLPIIIATIASFIFGWIWYGPLFGKKWMELNKISHKDIKDAKHQGMAKMMILNFIGTLITAYVISLLIYELSIIGFGAGVIFGIWLAVGFLITTTILGSYLWDNKPFGLFILNSAYWLINLALISGIISRFAPVY